MADGAYDVGAMNVASGRGSRALMHCPHCNGPMRIADSERKTETVKYIEFQCLNTHCTWSALYSLDPVHEISPSAMPNPDIHVRPRPDGFPRKRFPSPLDRHGGDPPDLRQIPMFGT